MLLRTEVALDHCDFVVAGEDGFTQATAHQQSSGLCCSSSRRCNDEAAGLCYLADHWYLAERKSKRIAGDIDGLSLEVLPAGLVSKFTQFLAYPR